MGCYGFYCSKKFRIRIYQKNKCLIWVKRSFHQGIQVPSMVLCPRFKSPEPIERLVDLLQPIAGCLTLWLKYDRMVLKFQSRKVSLVYGLNSLQKSVHYQPWYPYDIYEHAYADILKLDPLIYKYLIFDHNSA